MGQQRCFLWREQRLVVEFDGYGFHADRGSFERDRRKTTELQHHGLRVERFTWRRLDDEPHALVADLTRALFA
jgi:very-short-patch-repair endonuclease